MKPVELSKALYYIASKIEASKNPDRKLVSRDLTKIIAQLVFAQPGSVDLKSNEPLVLDDTTDHMFLWHNDSSFEGPRYIQAPEGSEVMIQEYLRQAREDDGLSEEEAEALGEQDYFDSATPKKLTVTSWVSLKPFGIGLFAEAVNNVVLFGRSNRLFETPIGAWMPAQLYADIRKDATGRDHLDINTNHESLRLGFQATLFGIQIWSSRGIPKQHVAFKYPEFSVYYCRYTNHVSRMMSKDYVALLPCYGRFPECLDDECKVRRIMDSLVEPLHHLELISVASKTQCDRVTLHHRDFDAICKSAVMHISRYVHHPNIIPPPGWDPDTAACFRGEEFGLYKFDILVKHIQFGHIKTEGDGGIQMYCRRTKGVRRGSVCTNPVCVALLVLEE